MIRISLIALTASTCLMGAANAQGGATWKIHDSQRPKPAIVNPDGPDGAPADAVVLFDGKDASAFVHEADGAPIKWKVENGYLEVVKSGDIVTKQSFGDCQLHVEWSAPGEGSSQGSGNSGLYFMGKYEIQVLNSHGNVTYADGQAASVYAQYPPLVNASRAPREWQTYDIVFRGPRFNEDGSLARPVTFTVFHNGVLVQDHVTVAGSTSWMERQPYKAHPEKLPLRIQDHGNPVRYRKIWLRELGEPQSLKAGPETPRKEKTIALSNVAMDRIAGTYGPKRGGDHHMVIWRDGDTFWVRVKQQVKRELHASAPARLFVKEVDVVMELLDSKDGKVDSIRYSLSGEEQVLYRMK